MNESYKVTVSRDEAGYWIAEAVDVPGAHTFAKRLDQIPARIAEAIAAILERDSTERIGIVIDVHLDRELDRAVHEAAEARTAADHAAKTARESSRRVARELISRGVSLRDAGVMLGVTHQRIDQLLKS